MKINGSTFQINKLALFILALLSLPFTALRALWLSMVIGWYKLIQLFNQYKIRQHRKKAIKKLTKQVDDYFYQKKKLLVEHQLIERNNTLKNAIELYEQEVNNRLNTMDKNEEKNKIS